METNSTCPDSTCRLRNSRGYCTSSGPCIAMSKTVKVPDNVPTKIGYDQIIEKIVNRTVEPPAKKTCIELTAWLTGYADCQNAIIDIILKMKDQYGR